MSAMAMAETIRQGSLLDKDEKKPIPKRVLSPAEQAVQDRLDKLAEQAKKEREELKKVRKQEVEVRKAARTAEVQAQWVIFRYVQGALKKGDKAAGDLVNAALQAIQPREGYDQAKAESDKAALKAFITVNYKPKA
jgi:hypothetical protein